MAAVTSVEGSATSSRLSRKFAPLLSLGFMIFLALVVLPSALTLPQSNPTTTLEYAPVPPDNQTPPSPNGNINQLGLATTSGLTGGGGPGGTGPGGVGGLPNPNGGILGGVGKNPETKRCVGVPPRQTEDPNSPPCVADFRGDNFGSTYQGVTREEVTVLVYVQGNIDYTSGCGNPGNVTPDRQYFDLAQPPQPNEHCIVRDLRVYQQYFNERYQTYNRFVHMWAYFSGSGQSPEERRADAADNYQKLHPFAVVTTAQTFNDDYLDNMASRGVLNFGSFLLRDNKFFGTYPGLVWGFPPSLQEQAASFAAYLCHKVVGHPVDSGGDPTMLGKPRVYGYWHSGDPMHPEYTEMADVVKQDLAACPTPIHFAADATFPEEGFTKSAHHAPTAAAEAAAEFRQKGVTTVIWPGGLETNFTQQAGSIGYRPEFMVLGDGQLETDTNGIFQDQNVWNGARVITPQTYVDSLRHDPCYTSFKEAYPQGDDNEVINWACPFYTLLRQLFTGIEVAGPRLSPTSIDQGFHAIPAKQSTNPSQAACFYAPGDYTCVKDAESERWDPNGHTSASSPPGCYRSTQAGLRYLADGWPDGNSTAQDSPSDPCNLYDAGFEVNQQPPSSGNPTG